MKTNEELKTKLEKLRSEERDCRKKLLKAYSEIHVCKNEKTRIDIDNRIESLYLVMRVLLKKRAKFIQMTTNIYALDVEDAFVKGIK